MAICSLCTIHKFSEPLEAWNQDPDGLCLLHSKVAEKDKDGGFTLLIEEKKKKGDHKFKGVFFPGDVSFKGFAFNEADFKEATFFSEQKNNPRMANFQEATFSGNADFRETKFLGIANFERATFLGEANFYTAEFSKVNFAETKFLGETFFVAVTFHGKADFWHAKIGKYGRALLSGRNYLRWQVKRPHTTHSVL